MIMTKQRIRTLACLAFLAFAFSVGLPAVADAAEKVPAGFVALAENAMPWDEAQAWCKQQGGKLPLLNNAAAVPDHSGVVLHADGFGKNDDPWPAELPGKVEFWTGTAHAEKSNQVWYAVGYNGKVTLAYHIAPGRSGRVICVK